MIIKQQLQTKYKSQGVNTCDYFLIHSTGNTGLQGNINVLTTGGKVSVHFICAENGDLYQIGSETDIMWHAGECNWKGIVDMNPHAIGIEVIGPNKDGGFTDAQRATVASLIKEMCKKHNIPKENVLRHCDITSANGSKGILYDRKTSNRKPDIQDTWWNSKFKSFEEYRTSLFEPEPTPKKESKYTKVMENDLKETGFVPLFSEHSGSGTLTEQETKELIEIGFARYSKRLK